MTERFSDALGDMPVAERALLRVLVADDNRDVADSTASLLSLCGCDVHVCYDGPTALADAVDRPPQVCLFDLEMPGMDGDELVLRVRAALPGAAILFAAVSGMDGEEARRRVARAGFHRHLVKPVAPGALLGIVGAG